MPLDNFLKSLPCTEVRASIITEKNVTMIAIDLKPIHLVKGEGFLKLMNCLEPDYKVPCRKFITDMKHEIAREATR